MWGKFEVTKREPIFLPVTLVLNMADAKAEDASLGADVNQGPAENLRDVSEHIRSRGIDRTRRTNEIHRTFHILRNCRRANCVSIPLFVMIAFWFR